jgi:nitroimidazol reductase NimA-like FMN-containing flavoprotein (pyridoxamine 5'-phosphate oxidase superfamily)
VETKYSLEPHKQFLEEARMPVRLACTTRQGWPMVLSLWFLYDAEKLYCATQKSAKLVHHLQQNPRCAFEIAGDQPPYRGVRGQAEAVLRPDLGQPMLERLIRRYLQGPEAPLGKTLLANRHRDSPRQSFCVGLYC